MFQIIAKGTAKDVQIDEGNNKVTGYFKIANYKVANPIDGWNFEAYVYEKDGDLRGTGSFMNEGQEVRVIGELTEQNTLVVKEIMTEDAPIGIIGDRAYKISSTNNDSILVQVSAKTSNKPKDAKYYTSFLVSFFVNGGLTKVFSKYMGTSPEINVAAVGTLENREYQGKQYFSLYRPVISLLPGNPQAKSTTTTVNNSSGVFVDDLDVGADGF